MVGEVNYGLLDPDAVYKGVAHTNDMMQDYARKRAGQFLNRGDRQGAIGALNESGDIDNAAKLKITLDENDSRVAAMDNATRAASAKRIVDAATQLDQIGQQSGYDAVLPAFEQYVPVMKQEGIKDDEIDVIRKALQANPKGFLTTFRDAAVQHAGEYDLAPGQTRFDRNNQPIASVAATPKYQVLPPGSSLVQEPGATLPAVPGQSALGPTAQPGPVAAVESGGDPNAVSPKGATGTMQTMPTTLADPGYGVAPAKDNSPAEQTRVGRDYLGAMQNRYHDPATALVAYNWGPGHADEWVKNGAKWNDLPPETRDYIGRVTLAQARGQTPDFGPPGGGASQTLAPAAGPRIIVQGTPEEGMWSPRAIHLAATKYLMTGQFPAVGLSGKGASAKIRAAIMEDAAAQNDAAGISDTDAVAGQATFKATQSSLRTMMTSRAQVGAFEGTANNSLDLVTQLAPKGLAGGGSPAINRWIQAGRKSIEGDPDVVSLDNAVQTAMNEYAKVVSGATNGAVTSDTARAHAQELINAAMTPQGLQHAITVLKQEMGFRINNMDDQINQLGKKLRVGNQLQARRGDHDAFMKSWTAAKGSDAGADDAWSKYTNAEPFNDQSGNPRKYAPWRQYFPELAPKGTAPTNSGGGGPKVRTYNAKTGKIE